jgi:hypothetical protein
VTPQTVLLALLVFVLVATRPFEETRWRDGRISDSSAALLVVGRLPVLILGFAVVTARPFGVAVAMTAVAVFLAAVLRPIVLRRLRRVRVGR